MKINVVRFEVLTAVVMKSIIFWDIATCSLLKVNRRFGGTYPLHLQGRRKFRAINKSGSRLQADLVSCSAYSSTLKIESICSSTTSVDFKRTTRRYIPEDSTLQNERSYFICDRRSLRILAGRLFTLAGRMVVLLVFYRHILKKNLEADNNTSFHNKKINKNSTSKVSEENNRRENRITLKIQILLAMNEGLTEILKNI
jgi:hypothetical protein